MFKSVLPLLCVTLFHFKCFGEIIVELSYIINSESAMWPTKNSQPFELITTNEGFTNKGYWYASNRFCSPEHFATHVDAPYHFAKNGWKLHEIPLKNLIVPAVVIDISQKVEDVGANYELTAADVVHWVDNHGPLPNNSIVLVQTGWYKRYGNKAAYFGHPSDYTQFKFPGINVGAAQTLVGYRESSDINIVAVGIDTPSLDYGQSQTYPTHVEFAKNNIYGIENLHNIQALPLTGAELTVMPLNIEGGTGSPCRVIARFNRNSATSFHPLKIILIFGLLFAMNAAG